MKAGLEVGLTGSQGRGDLPCSEFDLTDTVRSD